MSAPTIIEKLRHVQHYGYIPFEARTIVTEAADTIEALLGALEFYAERRGFCEDEDGGAIAREAIAKART
jgi:hypothetical protein